MNGRAGISTGWDGSRLARRAALSHPALTNLDSSSILQLRAVLKVGTLDFSQVERLTILILGEGE